MDRRRESARSAISLEENEIIDMSHNNESYHMTQYEACYECDPKILPGILSPILSLICCIPIGLPVCYYYVEARKHLGFDKKCGCKIGYTPKRLTFVFSQNG